MISARINDIIVQLRSFSLKRMNNFFSIIFSYYISRTRRIVYQKGLPLNISVEPTNLCNLHCPQCPSGSKDLTRKSGNLDKTLFKSIIEQVYQSTPYLTLYFQGEPYLNKSYFEFIEYAVEHRMYVTSSTNGHFLNDNNAKRTVESGLSKLIISIDGTTQEVFEKYRVGGDLQTVIDGTKRLAGWKKKLKSRTPYIVCQYLVLRSNEHQVGEIKRIARRIGVDNVFFKTAQIDNFKYGNELIPENQKYSRYKKLNDGTFQIKNKLRDHCWRSWSSCVFTWDGIIVPCCFDKDAKFEMGSIQKANFKEVWFGELFNEFRKKILNNRNSFEICNNCTEGGRIWI